MIAEHDLDPTEPIQVPRPIRPGKWRT